MAPLRRCRIHTLLLPHAEAGDARSQYALATIHWWGLCCDSEEEHHRTFDTSIQEATRWWTAAASQGYWYALDNLATNGVGPEADRARRAWSELARERHDLIGRSHGMPVYGPSFVQELSRRLYSRVDSALSM